jgi:chorismate synthase
LSWNSFGRRFRFTTWGESHGPAIGVLIEGCPGGVALEASDIQRYLDQRRPGRSRFASMRRETDRVTVECGTDQGQTTGGPIALRIENEDARSKDYAAIAGSYRPGHADFTYDAKYKIRDWRGGGRASARETAMRVAAGAVARKIIADIAIETCVVELGGQAIDRSRFDPAQAGCNPFLCPDEGLVAQWEERLDAVRRAGSSVGAVVECSARGAPLIPAGPMFGAMMSINGVKGVDIDGNVVQVAFKPTSSISAPLATIGSNGEETMISTKGRHDPCIGIRGAPVVAAMMALVLADERLLS